jgi:hypothetical protein
MLLLLTAGGLHPAWGSDTSQEPGLQLTRRVPLQVQAWAFRRSKREIYVRRIRICELQNTANTVCQEFCPTFSVQNLTLPTAHPHQDYEVNVTWSDGTHYCNWYRVNTASGQLVQIDSPL